MPQSQEENASISFDGKQLNAHQTIRVGLLDTTAVVSRQAIKHHTVETLIELAPRTVEREGGQWQD